MFNLLQRPFWLNKKSLKRINIAGRFSKDVIVGAKMLLGRLWVEIGEQQYVLIARE